MAQEVLQSARADFVRGRGVVIRWQAVQAADRPRA